VAISEVVEAIALARHVGDPIRTANVLGLAAYVLGDTEPQRALALAREGVELASPLKLGQAPLAWVGFAEVAALHGNHRDALTYWARAMDESHWAGTRPVLGAILRRVGHHLAEDDPETATVLHGVGDALAPTYPISARAAGQHQQAIATTDAALGDKRRHELYTRGKAMDADDAVSYAHAAINRALRH
jgi:hypothetical protein